MPFIYTFSTGSTEVYDASDYSAVVTLQQVSQPDTNYINSVYNLNYQKIFAGPAGAGSTGLTIYDSGNTKTVINISADTFAIAVDNTNDLIAMINVSNYAGPPDNIVVIVDASSDTVVNTVNVIDSYKGDITSDNNGYCYVVGDSEIMTKVDIVNGVTADTVNIGDGTNLGRRVIFNPTNGYIYTLNPDLRVRVWDPSGWGNEANISLTANTGFYVYNPDEDYIYVGNVTGGTNDFVITTISCASNTILSNTFIYSGATIGKHSSGTGMYGFYSTDTQYLYVGDTESDSILVLNTSAIYPPPTPTVTSTNTSTPTVTSTNTPTNTNTPSPTTTCPIVLGTTVISNSVNIESYGNNSLMEVDTYNSYLWIGTDSNVEVYNSGGTYVTGYTITFPQSITFDSTNNKMFVSVYSSTTIIDSTTLLTSSTITHSGVTAPESSTYDSNTGKLGILDFYINKIAIIDTNTELLDGYITIATDGANSSGYKGMIESDTNNGKMYYLSPNNILGGYSFSNKIFEVNPSTLTTGATINYTASTPTTFISAMRFNPTNGYMYVLESNTKVVYFDTSTNTIQGSISISGYSGFNNSMIYDINKDYLYISNRQSPSTHGIIVIDCSTNTVISFKNSILLSTGLGGIEYEPNSQRLFYSTSNNGSITRLCT